MATPSKARRVDLYGPYEVKRESKSKKAGGKPTVSKRYVLRARVNKGPVREIFSSAAKANVTQELRKLREAHAQPWVLWDPATCLPFGWNQPSLPVHLHAIDFVAHAWSQNLGKTRDQLVMTMVRIVPALLSPEAPELDKEGRKALRTWLRASLYAQQPVAEDEHGSRAYLDRWCLPLDLVDNTALINLNKALRSRINGKPAAITTVRSYTYYARRLFRFAASKGRIAADPFKVLGEQEDGKLYIPSGTTCAPVSTSQVISRSEIFALAAAVRDVYSEQNRRPRSPGSSGIYYAHVLTLGLCGCRRGELALVRRRDVDLTPDKNGFGRLTLRQSLSRPNPLSNNGSNICFNPLKKRLARDSRTVPIEPALVTALHRHLAEYIKESPDALVFPAARGGLLTQAFDAVVKRAKENLWTEHDPRRGLRIHDLRHSAAVNWLKDGVLPRVAMQWMGHKMASTFHDVYANWIEDDDAYGTGRMTAAREREDQQHHAEADSPIVDDEDDDPQAPGLSLVA